MRHRTLVKQLSVVVCAVALTPLLLERVMAKSMYDDAESVSTISPSQLGTNLPGGPMGVSASAPPQRVIPGTLDLTRAVQMVVAWHPAIAESIGKLYQQQQNVTIARSGYYPQISGGLRSGYDSGLNGSGESQAFTLSMSQMLYDFGKVSSTVDSALARVNGSQAAVLLAVDQVTRETSFSVIELQRAQTLQRLAREQVDGLAAIADLAKKRSDMGASTRSDLIQARSRVEAAMATQLQFTAQLNRWRGALSSLLGSQAPVSVTPGFPDSLEHSCQGVVPD
ncbi:MAG: TolC family protein, partial [Pseudomonas sp.]|nr:TolC family protein [Pseudomonas sp.]